MFRTSNSKTSAHSKDIWCVSWWNNSVVTGGLDGCVNVWVEDDNNGLKSLSRKYSTAEQKVGITSACLTSDESQLITCSQESIIRFYDMNSTDKFAADEYDQIAPGFMEAWSIATSADDSLIVAGTSTGKINIWDLASKQHKSNIDLQAKFILQSKFSQDGKTIASVGVDGSLHLVDVQSEQPVHSISASGLPVRAVSFSNDPTGKLVFSASDDRHVSVYDSVSGRVINSFSHTGLALTVDGCSPDRRQFVVGTSDHKVYVWDMGCQQCLQVIENAHKDPVWGVSYRHGVDSSFGYEKTRFVSVGEDCSIQFHDFS